MVDHPRLLVVSALALAALACQALTGSPTAAPAATSAALGLSRATPFPAGQPANTPNWTVEVLEVVRGDEAGRRLAQANQFNAPARDGYEYVLIRLRARRRDVTLDTRPIAATDFQLTGDRDESYFKALAVSPEPALEAELIPGGSGEGWTVYEVGVGEGNLVLIIEPIDEIGAVPPHFLAVDPGAALPPDPALATIAPTPLGEDPREPAALGDLLVTEDWEITALEMVRGDEALKLVMAANSFNDPPGPGLEYVAVYVRARYIATRDDVAHLDSLAFYSQDGDGREFDTPAVIDPEPELQARLFPGGTAEGWVTVLAPVDVPVSLVFKHFLDFDGQQARYVALAP
jgi:hypothetical protein